MSKKLYLSFLWHMHQPYYKDDCANTTLMPWVFLHATKDYYDIPWYMEKFPKIKATFNLVPSLMAQIDEYISGNANDKFLEILKKEIVSLSKDERDFLEEYLFLANEEYMIKPFSRYYELLLKYRMNNNNFSIFSDDEILDLEVLFLLSWCGNYLRQNNGIVQNLLNQKSTYDQTQKTELLNTMFNFLKEIIPYYNTLFKEGKISVSTTPFYHPILPLLLDRKSAVEARADVALPFSSGASYDEFANMQVEKAVSYFENKFGQAPIGFWPSEGSVSEKTINLLAKNGVKWACSDEEILFKTLNSSKKEALYKPYYLDTKEGRVNLFFRDKYLSDLIGFEFSKKSAKAAAGDFVSHLKNIYYNAQESVVVPVILDGENAWEFYPNNAQNFFEELYKLLSAQSWCELTLFDEISKCEDLKANSLYWLASGSWISGNFDIWIGSGEKNRAWELLDMTKLSFDGIKENLSEELIEKINKEFLVALGSDWFWWYGDDHYTELNHQFDEQFRAHLKNIFELMEIEVPKEIYTPIVKRDKGKLIDIKPTDFVAPTVDGNMSNFFEWLNSGRIDIKKEFTTMDSSSLFVEYLYYGVDRESNLYLYLKGDRIKSLKNEGFELRLTLNNLTFIFDIKEGKESTSQNGVYFDIAYDTGVELKLYECKHKRVKLIFEVYRNKKRVQRYPLYDESILDFENLFLRNWYI
ncbi:glycoside hydrolase family 57 protein [Halarcobacter ebronensis]|uniref:Glycoside hydrolase n=1 Tax=Halarcobacter ebronensis TaxID=1462615 RepID=A0A4Q1AMS9_9BACT|nr:glycoside hydrolase family 57 protein [Halarcobacter ebronensis]QKF83239.1 amylopullulanase [Halarcobacter ebronensis]RXK05126.1 glycoside hydrolase [Halarcobacter ebronensis]